MKNRAIEFYRFLTSVGIAVFLFNVQFLREYRFPRGGYIGVEFFLILSGFPLMKTFSGRRILRWSFWAVELKSCVPLF